MSPRASPQLPGLLAEVNARISEYAAGSDAGSETWEFVCECGVDGCQERVALTVRAYSLLREANGPVLAEGHGISRAEIARR